MFIVMIKVMVMVTINKTCTLVYHIQPSLRKDRTQKVAQYIDIQAMLLFVQSFCRLIDWLSSFCRLASMLGLILSIPGLVLGPRIGLGSQDWSWVPGLVLGPRIGPGPSICLGSQDWSWSQHWSWLPGLVLGPITHW